MRECVRACLSGCMIACVHERVRLRKFVEAELTMTMKIKVIDTDENIPKIYFGYSVDPSTAW